MRMTSEDKCRNLEAQVRRLESENETLRARLDALCSESADAIVSAPATEGDRYPLSAVVYKRHSTNEWILELSGSINDTSFVNRHTQPIEMAPEDVPGLPTLYEKE